MPSIGWRWAVGLEVEGLRRLGCAAMCLVGPGKQTNSARTVVRQFGGQRVASFEGDLSVGDAGSDRRYAHSVA